MRQTQNRSVVRQQKVLEAALACFSETGIEQTDMRTISARADTSLGSIYYQFGNRDGLVAAVYLEGLARYQQALMMKLAASRSARSALAALIEAHIDWSLSEPLWARFLLTVRRDPGVESQIDSINELNRHFAATVAEHLRPHIASGTLSTMPIDLFLAIVLGPCQEYIRGIISGRPVTPPDEAKAILAESAWRSLRLE
jgi:AcrR family transcriptional regulator